MPLEYKTVKFENSRKGLQEKDSYTAQMVAAGWRISSESIESGHVRIGEDLCRLIVCFPLLFLPDTRTSGWIVVTYVRDT